MKEKKLSMPSRTFRLPPDSIAAINAMPDRNVWIRHLNSNALAQQKTA
jgi:hypothetical protein